ncbi:unnamed protein product [Leptidea sinapis]|uniref:Uncharacterized protein n=1 Tax=Leptidea sinapis TaxID=189913 RepID=A0A5E4R5U7_9NEOP|nr:unnamed protein product [Leptidea sinapis]
MEGWSACTMLAATSRLAALSSIASLTPDVSRPTPANQTDKDSFVRICAICLPSELRRPVRKGKDKENRILHDIISLLKSVDPDILPVFVARDFEKLPPITLDHLDHLIIQADIKTIKES